MPRSFQHLTEKMVLFAGSTAKHFQAGVNKILIGLSVNLIGNVDCALSLKM